MPLFYSDMDTLIQRLGELRLIEQVTTLTVTKSEFLGPPMLAYGGNGKEDLTTNDMPIQGGSFTVLLELHAPTGVPQQARKRLLRSRIVSIGPPQRQARKGTRCKIHWLSSCW